MTLIQKILALLAVMLIIAVAAAAAFVVIDPDLALATVAAIVPAAEAIPVFLRYRDLVARGIVTNRMTLQRWIEEQGFPPGRLLGPNTRVWAEAEVEAWLAMRPIPARIPDTDAKKTKLVAAAARARAAKKLARSDGEAA